MLARRGNVPGYRRQLEAAVTTICALTSAAALAWLYLLTLHGGYWRTGHRLPPGGRSSGHQPPGKLPAVTAVIPARNEAGILPACLPTLLNQDYQGVLRVIVVDDDSSDGTGKAAAAAALAAGWRLADPAGQSAATGSSGTWAAGSDPGDRELLVVRTRPAPPGWAGKVWAMAEGSRAVGPAAEYILFTDADIAYEPGTLAEVAQAAAGGDYDLVSQMALLRTGRWPERLLVPAFVYFFAQLYPFGRVSRPRSRTAAAAGGCMLVRVSALAAAGGVEPIRDARIDDVALGRLLKRAGGRCWLGLSAGVLSMRPYDRLGDIWDMVVRSAYTQLRYSTTLTAAAVLGLAWLYLLPPAAALAGLALLATGSTAPTAIWLAAAGLAGWLMMAVSYVPMLRLYRLSAVRGLTLPVIAALYAAMTADSARRHHRGRGGEWKGRVIPPACGPPTCRSG